MQSNKAVLRTLLCLFVILLVAACSSNPQQAIEKGDPFPFNAMTEIRQLGVDHVELANRNLLVNFWATWCRPCREEMPYLQQLSDSLDSSKFAVIGISVDDDRNLVKEFLLQYEIHYPNYIDENSTITVGLLGIKTFPQTLLVSSKGIILERIEGQLSPANDRLQNFLETSNLNSIRHLATRSPVRLL